MTIVMQSVNYKVSSDTYSSGANGDTSNRTPASSAEMDDGPSQRDHFMRRGFPSRRSLGNRRFSNNKFEEADRSAFWRGSKYEQDEETQPTGGVFGSRRPALSGAAIAVEEFHTVDVFAQYIYERGIWIQYTTTNSVANLCQTLHDNIAKAGYSKLTPVREYGIPVTLAGRDLIACAQTGSGKTDTYSSGANGDTSNRTPASSA
ncbi:putative ATP-dependent RNA helicase DDX4, partial [Manis javanica]